MMSAHLSHNAKTSKDKVRFCLAPMTANPLSQSSPMIMAAIDMVAQATLTHVVVDRGHHYSDGSSEVCFWLSSIHKVDYS